jgi:hypothetical protein
VSEPREILGGVARFLDELRPTIDDSGLSFRARIASALLDSVAAEDSQREALAASEAARREAIGVDEAELLRRLAEDPPPPEEEERWRAAILAGLSERLAARNPRFDLRRDLP